MMEYLKNNPADDISIIFKSEENGSLIAEIAPFTLNYPLPAQDVLYYLCKNGTCQAPVNDFEKLSFGVTAN